MKIIIEDLDSGFGNLFTLLNVLEAAAANQPDADNFASDVMVICKIGKSLTKAVWGITSDSNLILRDFDEIDKEGLITAFSLILRNPNLPVNVYNAIHQAFSEVLNEKDLSKFEASPEYLKELFR